MNWSDYFTECDLLRIIELDKAGALDTEEVNELEHLLGAYDIRWAKYCYLLYKGGN